MNPLGFTEDGNAIVNQEFLIWVYDLQREVVSLRKRVKQ